MFNRKFYEENKIQLTPYLEVPRHFLSSSNNIIETCRLRNLKFQDIQKGIIESPYEELFNKWYGGLFDRELIIFIEQRENWRHSLRSKNIIIDEEYNKNYISLDFFNIDYMLNIEIDSIQHHQNKDLDFVRDQYLYEVFGIKTIRLYGIALNETRYIVDDYLKNPNNISSHPHYFRFEETSSKLFSYKFSQELETLDRLYYLDTFSDYYQRKGIILTEKDIGDLGITYDLQSTIEFAEKYYNQEISLIPKSQDYTLKEALIELNDFSWYRWMGQKNIPEWVIELKGIPPKELGLKCGKVSRNYGTKKLKEKLSEYGYNNMEVLSKYT